MKVDLRAPEISLIGFFLLAGCGMNARLPATGIDEVDLNYCITNPELIVSAEDNVSPSELTIRYCNYIPSGGDLKVIIVSTRGNKLIYQVPTPLGAKVYSEYRFRSSSDLLLLSYGFDNPDDEGNFFDYHLFEIGRRDVIKSGKSENRPRLSQIL